MNRIATTRPITTRPIITRLITASALVSAVLISAVMTVLAAPARADVIAVSLPTTAVISSRTLTLTGTVRVSSASNGVRSAGLWFRYSKTRSATLVGRASSRRPGPMAITARLDATRIGPGVNHLQVIDAADGSSQIVALDLRRQSRVAITHAEFRGKDRMALAVRLMHYDPKTDGFIASRRSPVRLQEDVDGSWVTLVGVTTDKLGLAGTLVPAGPNVHLYRAVRLDGATVWAATSLTVRAGKGIVATTLAADPF